MEMLNRKNVRLLLAGATASMLLVFSGCGSNDDPVVEPALGDQTILADGTIDYIDYKGETRNAPADAAAAEYHTGTGYGSTLFDSPKNKCQNCHNELYDTWESSMHGQSWKDKVFQSKMQDFLRTHINKIGTTSDIQYEEASVGVGTKNMFKGAAKTCIKCHAPGGYYANDFSISIVALPSSSPATTAELAAAQITDQDNSIATTGIFDPTLPVSVVAVSKGTGALYKATYQVGHQANQEGITCAFCHSVETPRLMKDGDTYTLKKDMRSGAHGAIIRGVGTTLVQEHNASSQDMNNFFRLWGPEKPADYANTNKGADDINTRAAGSLGGDGRYTMTSVDLNGTDGKVHYTGGPFYGPYGVSGKSNENADDETNRLALINPYFHEDNNNHFGDKEITTGEAGDHGKSLCLTCHQRSAGAATPSVPGQFMELCSTQMAVTTGDDTAISDSMSSPKCQKCHMERIEGVLLHKWARPDLRYVASDFDSLPYKLTPQLDGDDTTVPAGDNPQRDGWYNSHGFLGASKTGHKTSVTAKIKSGFDASLTAVSDGTTLTVDTTLKNLTAHMFPGAHPMRRVLTRVIVTDGTGAKIDVTGATGESKFGYIENNVQPLDGKALHETALSPVAVYDVGSAKLSFPGKSADLDGSATDSQKFSGAAFIIPGTDTTITNQTVTAGVTEGNVTNAAIVPSVDASNYTRIYGHETGKDYSGTFIVRPGFDSNVVESDTRLSPNETEEYSLNYNVSGLSGVTVTYKVYYMQKGANGKFITAADGFLDQAASDAKKLLVTEVYSETVTP